MIQKKNLALKTDKILQEISSLITMKKCRNIIKKGHNATRGKSLCH